MRARTFAIILSSLWLLLLRSLRNYYSIYSSPPNILTFSSMSENLSWLVSPPDRLKLFLSSKTGSYLSKYLLFDLSDLNNDIVF